MAPEAEDEQDPELAEALRLSREESGGDEAKDPAAMSVDELLEAREKAIEEEKQRFFDVRRHDSGPPALRSLTIVMCRRGVEGRTSQAAWPGSRRRTWVPARC